MDYSFLDDPAWNEIPEKDQPGVIGLAIDKRLSSDPSWSEIPDDDKPGFRNFLVSEGINRLNQIVDSKIPTDGSTLGAFAKTVSRIPENVVASGIRAVQGQEGASITDKGMGDKFVSWVDERNKKLSQEYSKSGDVPLTGGLISKKDVAEFGPNAAYSLNSMAGTIAGGAAGSAAGPAGSLAGAMAGGGVVAQRATGYQVMQDWLDKRNRESFEKFGRPITPEEEAKFKAEFDQYATESGLWEAGPEAAGNVLELLLMKSPLGKIAGLVPKGVKGKIASGLLRAGGMLATEGGTETVTQMGQNRAETKAGISEEPMREWSSPDDWMKSAREVLPAVMLQAGVMTGAGHAYRKVAGVGKDTGVSEVGNIPAPGQTPTESTLAPERTRPIDTTEINQGLPVVPVETRAAPIAPIPKPLDVTPILQAETADDAIKAFESIPLQPSAGLLSRPEFREMGRPSTAQQSADVLQNAIEPPAIGSAEVFQRGIETGQVNTPYVPEIDNGVGLSTEIKPKDIQELSLDALKKARPAFKARGRADIVNQIDSEIASKTSNIPKPLRQIFGIMRDEANAGGMESFKDIGEGGDTNAVGRASSHASWFKDIDKAVSKDPSVKDDGFSVIEFNNLLGKKESGKPLTERQSILWGHMENAAEKYNREHPETVQEISDDDVRKKGFEPNYNQPVNLTNINIGDKLLFDGEEFEAKGFDKDGNMVFQDGIPISVDPFETVTPDAIKKAAIPGKAEVIQEPSKAASGIGNMVSNRRELLRLELEGKKANRGGDRNFTQAPNLPITNNAGIDPGLAAGSTSPEIGTSKEKAASIQKQPLEMTHDEYFHNQMESKGFRKGAQGEYTKVTKANRYLEWNPDSDNYKIAQERAFKEHKKLVVDSLPKELKGMADVAVQYAKNEFIDAYKEGLSSQNLTRRETAQKIDAFMRRNLKITPEQFYDKYIEEPDIWKGGEPNGQNAETQKEESQKALLTPGESPESSPVTLASSAGLSKENAPVSEEAGVSSEKKSVHDHSNTQVNLPEKESAAIKDFNSKIPDNELYTEPDDASYGRETEPHVTVRYGMDTVDPKEIAPAFKDMPPIKARMGKVSIFSTDKYDVVKVEIKSPELRIANKRIGDTVDLPGETFKDYQPHATIAYVKKGEGEKYVGDKTFEGKEFTVDKITLVAKDGKSHNFELTGKAKPKRPESVSEKKAKAQAQSAQETPQDARGEAQGKGGVQGQGGKVVNLLRPAEIKAELAKLQKQYEQKAKKFGKSGMVPPSVKSSALSGITKKMDALESELEKIQSQKMDFSDKSQTITVDGIDRSRVNSDGRVIANTDEGLVNFWKWFGDSKVVDEQGRPVVVYHGTTSEEDFSKFKPGPGRKFDLSIGTHFAKDANVSGVFSLGEYTLPSSYSIPSSGKNYWYKDKKGAARYDGVLVMKNNKTGEVIPYQESKHGSIWKAENDTEHTLRIAVPNGRIFPVYLNMENPLVINNKPNDWDEYAIAKATASIVFENNKNMFVNQVSDNIGYTREEAKAAWDNIKNGTGWKTYGDETIKTFARVAEEWPSIMNGIDVEDFKFEMAKAGYDGIIYNNTSRHETVGTDPTTYISFYPTQAKSATGNRGAFSPTDARIDYRDTAKKPNQGRVTAEQARSEFSELIQNVRTSGVTLEIVDKTSEISDPALRRGAMAHESATGRLVRGFFHEDTKTGKKTIYVVAGNTSSMNEVARILAHETVGHYGLYEFMGSELQPFLDFLNAHPGYGSKIKQTAKNRGIDYSTPEGKTKAAKEFFAELVEKGEIKPSLMTKLIVYVKSALRKMGFRTSFSDADIAEIIRGARGAVEGRGDNQKMAGKFAMDYSMAGKKAATANLGTLAQAEQMEKSGESREAIWQETGWWRGPDGQMKFEIDDTGLKVVNKNYWNAKSALKETNLSAWKRLDRYDNMLFSKMTDQQRANRVKLETELNIPHLSEDHTLFALIENKNIFDAYPEFKKMLVKWVPDYEEASFNGSFSNGTFTFDSKLKPEKLKSVIGHEIQHAIQDREDFARGGSPDLMQREYNNAQHRLNVLENEPGYIEASKKIKEIWTKLFDEKTIDYVKGAELDAEIVKQYPDYAEFRKLHKQLQLLKDDWGIDAYKRLSGEAESRLVQKRLDMTAAERKAEPPWITLEKMMRDEGLITEGQNPEDVLINRKGDGAAMSAGVTETPEFKAWFGKSKVVDKNGKPLMVYHGSPDARFLDEDATFKNRYTGETKGAHWFTSSRRTAETYADDRRAFDYQGAVPKVVPAFIKAENPLIIDAEGKHWRDAQNRGKTSDVIKKAQEGGYDSVIIRNVKDDYNNDAKTKPTDTYVVFESNQIKSTTNAAPTSDPRIDYSDRMNDASYLDDSPASLDDKDTDIPAIAAKWLKGRPNTSIFSRALSLPLYYYKKIPQLHDAYKATSQYVRDKYENVRALAYSPDGDSYATIQKKFQKKDAAAYKHLQEYLIHQDDWANGYRLNGDVLEGFTVNLPASKLGVDEKMMTEWPQPEGTFKTKAEAWAAADQAEADHYLENGGTAEGAEVLKTFRKMGHNMFDMLYAPMQKLIAEAKEKGLPAPTVPMPDATGKKVQVKLSVALAQMGDIQGSFFPRKREPGRYVLRATKDGANPIREHFDIAVKFENDTNWKAKIPVPINMRMLKLKKDGYAVTIGTSESLPENVFLDLAGQQLALEAILNKTMENISQDSTHTLSDMGIQSRWTEGKDGKKKFTIYGDGIDARNHPGILEELGGEYHYISNAKQGYPSIVFENAKEGVEEKVREYLFNYRLVNASSDALMASAMATELADILKARGARSSMIARGKETGLEVWKGYEEDPIIAYSKSAIGIAGSTAKGVMAKRLIDIQTGRTESWADYQNRILSETGEKAKYKNWMKQVAENRIDPAKQANAYNDLNTYTKDMLRNDEQLDRVIGTLHGIAALKYLAFKVSSAAVNMTSLATSVPATMNGMEKISLTRTPGLLAKALANYRTFKFGDSQKLDIWTARAFDYIEKEGWDQQQFNHEAIGALQSKFGSGFNRFMELGMLGFKVTEMVNRVSTIMATYQGIREKHTGDWNEGAQMDALERAKEVSDYAHGDYSKGNQPMFTRGGGLGGNLLRSAYIFKMYQHNYLLNMMKLGFQEKQYKALAWMAISPMVLAGAGAGVATPLIMAAAKAFGIGGDDPEEELYKWIESEYGGSVSQLARSGVIGLGGMGPSLSGSMDINILQAPKTIADLLGAPGGVAKDLIEGYRELSRGNMLKAAERLSPVAAFAGPVKAYRESTEGLTTGKDTPVFYGKDQVRLDGIEAAMRVLSFNPSRIAMIKERLYSERKAESSAQQQLSDIYSVAKRLFLKPYGERSESDVLKITEMMQQYNEMIKADKMLSKTRSLLTWDRIRKGVKRSLSAPKKEKLREVEE